MTPCSFMRKTPAIAIWCGGARAYSNQGGGDVIAPDNLVCGHLILTAKLSGASRHRFSSKIAFSQFVEIEQQQQQQPARTSVIARQPKSLKISRPPSANSLISAREKLQSKARNVPTGSKSAALLKLMEIAGDDWSRQKTGSSSPERSRSVQFSCPQSEGHFPAEDSCSVYYQCAQGTAHRRQCETGKVTPLTSSGVVWWGAFVTTL